MAMGRPPDPRKVGSSSILLRAMTSNERDMDRRVRDERDRAIGLLRSADAFLLTGHQRPDGDCIGAQAALSCVLRACGKTVRILNPDPPEPRYHYLSIVARSRFSGLVPGSSLSAPGRARAAAWRKPIDHPQTTSSEVRGRRSAGAPSSQTASFIHECFAFDRSGRRTSFRLRGSLFHSTVWQ